MGLAKVPDTNTKTKEKERGKRMMYRITVEREDGACLIRVFSEEEINSGSIDIAALRTSEMIRQLMHTPKESVSTEEDRQKAHKLDREAKNEILGDFLPYRRSTLDCVTLIPQEEEKDDD